MTFVRSAALAAMSAVLLFEPALAGPSAAAPGPIAGVGLSALVLVGGAYWLGRKFFASKK